MTTPHVTDNINNNNVQTNFDPLSQKTPNSTIENFTRINKRSSLKEGDKRFTKRTKADEQKLFSDILESFNRGLPVLAIALKYSLREDYIQKCLFQMFYDGKLDRQKAEFEVVSFTTLKKVIPNLPENFGEYVRVDYDTKDETLVMSAYSPENAD